MLVQDIMTTNVVSVTPDTPLSDVAELLHRNHFSGIPVVNETGMVAGVITERELFSIDYKFHLPTFLTLLKETHFEMGSNKELPHVAQQITRTTAKDIMNQAVYFARPELSLEELAIQMALRGVVSVPVTDSANHLKGIVTRSDFLKVIAKQSVRSEAIISERPIDNEFAYVQRDLRSRFSYVANARANIWLTTATVLFIVGFLAGMVYVVNPEILRPKTESIQQNLLP